jgi:Domain of unknown function (DUF397)
MTTTHHLAITNWRKSSRSAAQDDCVETGSTGDVIGYRDTKQAGLPAEQRPTLEFSRAANSAFLAALQQGNLVS